MAASIVPATQRDLERLVAGTVQSSATHVVTIDYHPQVTTQTQVLFNGRTLHVNSVQNLEERNIELVLICEEVVP
jgi:SPP1 family predicted phage head-tail adaptor